MLTVATRCCCCHCYGGAEDSRRIKEVTYPFLVLRAFSFLLFGAIVCHSLTRSGARLSVG